jgi:hypothetical protein
VSSPFSSFKRRRKKKTQSRRIFLKIYLLHAIVAKLVDVDYFAMSLPMKLSFCFDSFNLRHSFVKCLLASV